MLKRREYEMKETCIFIQALITGVFAMLYEKLGIFLPLMSIFMALMVMDYLSGMLASKHEAIEHPGDPAYGWNSKKGVNGIIKKVGYICVVFVAMMVDYLLTILSEVVARPMEVTAFGVLVTMWFILNEALSICENAGRMGAPVPDWMTKYIASLKTKVDDDGGNHAVG